MKRGTEVAVCHDGKWGRRIKGVVIDTKRGHHIKVRFPHPDPDKEGEDVEFWAKVIPTVRYERRKTRSYLLSTIRLKNYKHYGGWAEINWFCPWYAVYKWPRSEV